MNDYIERENAVIAIQKRIKQLWNDKEYKKKPDALDLHGVIPMISAIPSADVEPVKSGKWIESKGFWNYDCPFCGYTSEDTTHYCPNCGAQLNI